MKTSTQIALVIAAGVGTFIAAVLAVKAAAASGDQPMRATEHLKVNDCVEVISVLDPKGNDSYLLAWDKCGATSVAITKRF
jgi:hypothetical protein